MSPSHSTPLFKIERREVLEQRQAEKKKLTAPIELSVNELVIGTHVLLGKAVWALDRRVGPPFGSDHLPIVADLRVRPWND